MTPAPAPGAAEPDGRHPDGPRPDGRHPDSRRPDGDIAPEAVGTPTGRARLLAGARIVLAVLVLAAVTWALVRNWSDVAQHLRAVSPLGLLGGAVGALAAPNLTMLGWRALLADLGTPMPRGSAAGVFFVGQLGKYLPGSVWSVLAQAEMGSRLGIPRRRMAVAGLLSIGMSVLTGIAVGIPALPVLLRRGDTRAIALVAALAVPVLLACLHPMILNRLIATGLRLLRREPLEHELSGRGIAAMAAWLLLAWLAIGAGVLMLARDLAPSVRLTDLIVPAVCGFALASVAGMLAVVLPAGVGVRDGLLVLVLHTVLPLPAATAIAMLMRFAATLADVIWAAIGWSWARAHHLLGERA